MPTTVERTRTASELRLVLGQLVRRLRAENTLPLQHLTVLSRLERDGPHTTSELAAAERVRPQSMAQTLADLGKEGLIERRPDLVDRRQVILDLTAEGRRTIAADRRRREGWLARAIEDELTPDEQDTLASAVELLRRITDTT